MVQVLYANTLGFGYKLVTEITSWYKEIWRDHVMHMSLNRIPRLLAVRLWESKVFGDHGQAGLHDGTGENL